MSNTRQHGKLAIANCCGSYIISQHRHDLCSCKCGKSFIDGGSDYIRYGGDVRVLTVDEIKAGLDTKKVEAMKKRAKARFAKAEKAHRASWAKFKKTNPEDALMFETYWKYKSL